MEMTTYPHTADGAWPRYSSSVLVQDHDGGAQSTSYHVDKQLPLTTVRSYPERDSVAIRFGTYWDGTASSTVFLSMEQAEALLERLLDDAIERG